MSPWARGGGGLCNTTHYCTYGKLQHRVRTAMFMWKFVTELLRDFVTFTGCDFSSFFFFQAWLLLRMRVNCPYSSECLPQGCPLLWCLCWRVNKWGSARPQVQHYHYSEHCSRSKAGLLPVWESECTDCTFVRERGPEGIWAGVLGFQTGLTYSASLQSPNNQNSVFWEVFRMHRSCFQYFLCVWGEAGALLLLLPVDGWVKNIFGMSGKCSKGKKKKKGAVRGKTCDNKCEQIPQRVAAKSSLT